MPDFDFLNLIIALKNYQVVPMNHLSFWHLFEAYDFRRDGDHAAGEFGSVEITDSNYVAGLESPFVTSNTGREKALAFLAKSAFRAIIDI